MGRVWVLLTGFVLALSCAAAASAYMPYGWPVRPFHRQHAIRAFFGDPRTIFSDALAADGLQGPGSFAFHNGVDISAPNGTAVYPVVSGTVKLLDAAAVAVETLDGRTFQYFHVIPTVVDGEHVIADVTKLGSVQAPFEHVHLAEIDGFHVTNPLLAGHLTPYKDKTRPTVAGIEVRRAVDGQLLQTLGVCGRVSIIADAYDRPPLPVPGSFAGLPVTPAFVAWQLTRLGHGVVVPKTTSVDFRTTLPADRDFWSVYARGTYQNAPRFGNQQFGSMPGRYLFEVAPMLDTKTFPNGVYVITVTAGDERGNIGSLAQRISILNIGTTSGCPAPPPPPPPPPPVTTTTGATTTTAPTTP